MDNYAKHMFTSAVQAEQAELGVAERFQKMYRNRFTGDLDDDSKAFIERRSSTKIFVCWCNNTTTSSVCFSLSLYI